MPSLNFRGPFWPDSGCFPRKTRNSVKKADSDDVRREIDVLHTPIKKAYQNDPGGRLIQPPIKGESKTTASRARRGVGRRARQGVGEAVPARIPEAAELAEAPFLHIARIMRGLRYKKGGLPRSRSAEMERAEAVMQSVSAPATLMLTATSHDISETLPAVLVVPASPVAWPPADST